MSKFILLVLCLGLAACGDNSSRYLLSPVEPQARVGIRVGSVEVKDMVLPDYSEAPDMLLQQPDGGLKPIRKAVWGDTTAAAITGRLVAALSARTTARVAAEPWPLDGYPDAAVTVRVGRILAGNNGLFQMSGQFAIGSPEYHGVEGIQSFDIAVPLTTAGPAGIAAAKSAALDQLAGLIIARLR